MRDVQPPARSGSGTRLRSPATRATVQAREQTRIHTFPNEVRRVSGFVDELLRGHRLAPNVADELGLALRELLLNAIEHGNLGLSFEDKGNALAEGSWQGLVARRAHLEPYRRRVVRVKAQWAPACVCFTIADEGEGFDWRALPEPTDPDYILCDNGRGVWMAKLSVDTLRYNEAGNEVTIVKGLR